MDDPALTPSFRNAMLIALGLTASTFVGAGGCADRGAHALCVDTQLLPGDCAAYGTDPALYERGPDDPVVRVEEVCFDDSDGCDPCDAEAITGAAIDQADGLCTINELQRVTLVCGPDTESAGCCYKVQLEGDLQCAVPGRPLLAGTERGPRVAVLHDGRTWLASRGEVSGLRRPHDPDTVAALRNHWLACARYEHASVAAFARVSLQLLSLGAPAELLRAAQRAMGDEIHHAQLCFAVAAGYGGAPPSEAGPLRVDGSVATGMDLETALREAIFDGALGEGAAAMEALEGARACDDPVVRALLLGIAADERRHALLAYRTVQWALVAHPRRARAIVRACLRAAPPAAARSTDDDALGRYGVISAGRRALLRRESWTAVVAPILSSMLADRPVA